MVNSDLISFHSFFNNFT